MKKRILSLLCVLALCLGLLPTTALAAGEIELYVAGQRITESGCYANQDGTWTKVDGTEPANGQFYYDADTVTLTLNEAEISNDNNVSVGSGAYYRSSVIAFSQSADVSLKIVLQGESTITGTGGIRVASEAGDASLSIAGPGSLAVTVGGYADSGIVLVGLKNVNLDIDGADVTASSSFYGVYLISDTASTSAITVNNGSLTADGNSNVGIYYCWFNDGGTSNLTVSGNAVVDTRNSRILISSQASEGQVSAGSDGSGGIVFDGTEGTVYGKVELQDDLTINEGETLTVGKDASLTVPDGKTLTNNGTLVIQTGGQLNGTPTGSGTVITAPTITTESLPEGTVGTEYNQSLAAENNPTSWSVTIGTLPAGLTLKSDGTITGTPSAEGSSTFTVKAENSAGFTTKQYTLNIKPATVSVTGVTLNKNTLELYTGKSETLIATVEPADATNQDVTWSSNDDTIATVDNNGKVTAVKEGTATITATATDGSNISATCTVKVTQATYNISAEGSLDFGEAYTGYDRPTAKTVTITNTGNQQVTVTLPTATDFVITAGDGFTNGSAIIEPGKTATFTVQPKADLAVGSYKESINISGSNGNHKVSTSVDATFAVVDSNDTKVDNKLTVTSGISDNITYYTCPSCGYHNWTATEAGYRCDNCGYLESTRQLSGYGNVKGTYTPGSGATSTAASAVPQTGDESNPVLWTVLLLVSGLALGGLAIAKRKKQQ